MALFLPGGPAGGAPSGSLGAIVFARNRFGAYMRTRVIPTNPATAGQVLARNRMSSLSNSWFNYLTADQRAAWDTYAANVPVTNRLGQQIHLTGLNWYVACNALRRQADAAITDADDAPTVFNLATFNLTSISASEATQEISMTYEAGDDWTLDDGALLGYQTRPQNPSINFNNLAYRYMMAVFGVTATPPASPAVFDASFPFVEGQKLFCRFNCIIADGRIGAVQKYSVLATA